MKTNISWIAIPLAALVATLLFFKLENAETLKYDVRRYDDLMRLRAAIQTLEIESNGAWRSNSLLEMPTSVESLAHNYPGVFKGFPIRDSRGEHFYLNGSGDSILLVSDVKGRKIVVPVKFN